MCATRVQGIVLTDTMHQFTGNVQLENAKVAVRIIVSAEPSVNWRCSDYEQQPSEELSSARDNCAEFRLAASAKRRTHLFFYSTDNPAAAVSRSKPPVDVTLATQLTIERFEVLERMLTAWTGPASVVFYVSDFETERVLENIMTSTTMSKHKKLSCHFVFRRTVQDNIGTINV